VELSDNRELDPAEVALVAQRFARLALPAYPMWALPGGSVRWFTGPRGAVDASYFGQGVGVVDWRLVRWW